jgi:hypothetical protein
MRLTGDEDGIFVSMFTFHPTKMLIAKLYTKVFTGKSTAGTEMTGGCTER